MDYAVLWGPEAETSLVSIWLAARNRASVTDAANRIDQLLRHRPELLGESREDDRRILLVPPLGVKFRVLEDDRIVRVLDVWLFEARG
jgi:hypothetical protein